MTRRRKSAGKHGESPPGRVRIVAGKWRGRLLAVAGLPALRPTSARVRETLFNWLAARIEGARCLDLFAGSGALGFEALSRGARQTLFVETAKEALRALEQSRAALAAEGAEILRADAYALLTAPPAEPFDVVFLDPPYADESVTDLCRLLQQNGWLATDARVYFEQDRREEPAALPDGWRVIRQKCAGQVRYALAAAPQGGC